MAQDAVAAAQNTLGTVADRAGEAATRVTDRAAQEIEGLRPAGGSSIIG